MCSNQLSIFWQARLERRMDLVAEAFRVDKQSLCGCDSCRIGLNALEASVHREAGRVAESEQTLRAAESEFGAACHRNLFWSYEMGQVCLATARTSDARSWFLCSLEVASDQETHDFVLVNRANVLVCSETLGFDTDAEVDRIEGELSAVKTLDSLQSLVYENLTYIKLQKSLRMGNVGAIEGTFEDFRVRCEHGSGQVHFYTQWLKELPHFFNCHRPEIRDPFESEFKTRPVYKGAYAYRLRTISGFSHPDDAYQDSAVDLSNRLYLWVWRWLHRPSSVDVNMLLPLMKKAYTSGVSAKVSLEDRLLIRNSLGWIALLSGSSLSLLERLEAPLHAVAFSKAPWFELEWALIRYLFGMRDGILSDGRKAKEYLQSCILKLPNCSSKLVDLAKNTINPNHGRTVCEFEMIEDLFQTSVGSENEVRVNVWNHFVEICQKRLEVGEQVVEAFALLCLEPRIEAERFAEVVFGIRAFKYGVHENRVSSLLSRMRKLFSEVTKFEYKDGYVHLQVFEGIKVSVVGGKSLHQKIPKLNQIIQQKRSTTKLDGSSDLKKETFVLKKGDVLLRREVEGMLQKSRSATGRYLATLINSGILRRSGKGRSSKYQVLGDWKIEHDKV